MTLPELSALLNAAAQAGAEVTIRYSLGSRPTTHRIVPIAATGTVLRARDVNADRMRVFMLAHVELLDSPARPPIEPEPAPPAEARPRGEHERLAALVETLKAFGWHVRWSSDGIAVHALRAGGAPMSAAAASIVRNAGGAAQTRRLRRPWTVMAPGLPRARSLGTLEQAITLFMRQAALHAPALRRRRPPT